MSKPENPAVPASPLVSADEFIVEGILPCGEVHLFGGPSGAGKTTLLLQMMKTWLEGGRFFGHECKPQPFVYISCDRSRNGVKRTFRRTATNPDDIPFYSALSDPTATSIESIINKALALYPRARVLFIEGLGSKVPGGKINDYNIIAKFLSSLTRLCEARGLTIIGIVHSAKTKKGEEYLNPRERALGSVAWAAFSETIILVEPTHPDDASPARRIYLLPRNAREERYEMKFGDDGLLHPTRTYSDREVQEWIASVPPGKSFRLADAQAALPGVRERTLQRFLASAVESGRLTSTKKGIYTREEPDILDLGGGEDLADQPPTVH